MATDISTTDLSGGDATVRVAMDATAGVCEAVTLPVSCRSFLVRFKQSDDVTDDSGKVAHSATDGAAIGTGAFPVGSGEGYGHNVGRIPPAKPITYLAGGTNAGYAHLVLSALPVS
jgi:hypothetical protein